MPNSCKFYKILETSNYDITIDSDNQTKVLQRILNQISTNLTLQDDLFQSKLDLRNFSAELVQQAYDFYLKSIFSPPEYVSYLRYFYWSLFAEEQSLQTIIRVLLSNLRQKSVFNKELNFLKLLDKQNDFQFKYILQLLMTTLDFDNVENCPLSRSNKSTCLSDLHKSIGRKITFGSFWKFIIFTVEKKDQSLSNILASKQDRWFQRDYYKESHQFVLKGFCHQKMKFSSMIIW